jgi:DNA-binding NarL/FixJ family response regulator
MKTKVTVGTIIIEIETDEQVPQQQPVLTVIDKPEPSEERGNGNGAHLLSSREMRILELVSEGLSNKEIARRLCITESTCKVHLKAILRKLQCKNRTQAAIWHRNGVASCPTQEVGV